MKKLVVKIKTILCILILTSSQAYSESSQIEKVKLAFIYKFSSYVKWPDRDSKKPIRICFYNSEQLRETFLNEIKKIKLPVEICDSFSKSNLGNIDILYVGEINKNILKSAVKSKVLTIGHGNGFAEKGVIINFKMENERLSFEINKKQLDESKLSMSSQLLKLGAIVQ